MSGQLNLTPEQGKQLFEQNGGQELADKLRAMEGQMKREVLSGAIARLLAKASEHRFISDDDIHAAEAELAVLSEKDE